MDKRSMKPLQRFMAVLLCLAMLLPMVAVPTWAEETSAPVVDTAEVGLADSSATEIAVQEPDNAELQSTTGDQLLAVVYAASDFQAENSDKTKDDVAGGQETMNSIITAIKNAGQGKYDKISGALFCGDYSANYNTWKSDSAAALKACNAGANGVEAVLFEQWGLTDENVIYVQGNHDPAEVSNLDDSGYHEFEYYNVFVLNEDDFQWRQGDTQANSGNTDPQGAAQRTAENLESFLKKRVELKDNRPIFVAAHVPLHFGWRTEEKGGDNIYAKYIFDVLNDYGDELTIFYLFGHNHSSTYDDYIGGAAVYLPAGDKLRVPNLGSVSASTEYELNFTYMNAGYVGYFGGKTTPTSLSSSIFEIYEDKVVVARYNADGAANLKDEGKLDTTSSRDNWAGAAANTTVYTNDNAVATTNLKTFNVDMDYGALASGKMIAGGTGVLKVRGLYNTSYNVVWTSSNEAAVSVSPAEDGMSATVTANAVGTAKITAVVTEVGKTRAVGETTTLEYNVEVLDTTAGISVVLLEAGEHTFFKKVDSLTLGETYAFIDIEDYGYTIGRQEALHYNTKNEVTEGDLAADGYANRELNAAATNVFQLPVGSELLTLADVTNENCWWITEDIKEAGNIGFTIKTHKDRTYGYLYASEGDGNFLTVDKDQDRIATGNADKASSTGGAHWYYDAEHGLVSNTKTDGFQYALYYSQANTDFSAYRINHNGAHGDSKFNGNGTLANEAPKSRVYAFEQTVLTVAQNITAYVNDLTGYVNKDVGYASGGGKRLGGAQTGDKIVINNGTRTDEINVTIDMLSGTFDVTKPGTYSGLTVTYMGVKVADGTYTLVVNESATILKNDAAREYMDTIYKLDTKWYPGRQYLIADTDKAGIGHAMGVGDGEVKAYNILVQELPVGDGGMYIDASRYSDSADAKTENLVGRGIKDQGNINEYLDLDGDDAVTLTTYQEAIRLAWTVSQRFFPTTYTSSNSTAEISDVRNKDYVFLMSQMQIAGNAANRTLYIGANAEDTQLKVGSEAYTVGKETDDPTGTTADWWWELWQYSTSSGVHLNDGQVNHAYLFYNYQNIIGSTADGDATKNFQTEERVYTTGGNSFDHYPYRRTWIYERVTNIDTVSARISDKSARLVRRIEGTSESTHASTFTGDYILVDTTYAKGNVKTKQVPLTVSMLSGDFDLTKVGAYPNLTVTYQGVVVCTDYTLIIDEYKVNDYPEFPDAGAVRIDKQLDSNQYNYLETGVASIDLSVSGIPAQTGVNLVVILDASSSMQSCPHGTGADFRPGQTCSDCGGTITYNQSRMGLLESTLESMLQQIKAPMANGYTPDVDVAIATFNGYTPINTSYEFWYNGTLTDGTGDKLSHAGGQQTDEDRVDASQILLPFTNIAKVDPSFKNLNKTERDIEYSPGTNYDRGMELAYQLLKEKQEQDAVNGVTRETYVVFMSDGAPYQFNYFHGDPNVPSWSTYLEGNLTANSDAVTAQDAAVQSAFAKYNNAEGRHWMAEAIKGSPNETYKVIDRHAMTTDHITQIRGMGATMYTIGFGLAGDHVVSKETCEQVLMDMATDAKHYIPAADGDTLHAAFSEIAGKVRSAGNAVFKDQMGSKFNLVTGNKFEIINDQGEEEIVDLSANPPTITVKSYELYKRSEIGTVIDGVEVTETMVGTRKPVEPTILERVTFNDDGTVIKSDNKPEVDNILNGSIIEASTFFYNTALTAQNITVDGETISLEPETFYWHIGNIPENELVLSYSVYLVGSMEGLREEGVYDTNNFANLTYTNYLGNECGQSVSTPRLPWQQAVVGYAFYLVNDEGQPIINQSNGLVGSFERAVKITEPVYREIYLNSVGAELMSETIEADDVMPEGYTLFDPNAVYDVQLESTGAGYYKVSGTPGIYRTTYVNGIESTAICPEYGQVNTTNNATANTVVWFAIKAITKAYPDTVVIDFGLPVDINVVENDTMMGNYGEVKYLTQASEFPIEEGKTLWKELQKVDVVKTSRFLTETGIGNYGKLQVLKDDNGKGNGKLRYTLNTTNGMQMDKEETFVYAVEYTGNIGTQGYYYSTVTVIPATSIYYEDTFLTYAVKDYETGNPIEDSAVQWSPAVETDATQAEDRPGEFNLTDLDANNIYGYDGAYTNMATYSMNNARKVTVGKQTLSNGTEVTTYATATFTFSGTGFDIVSVTSDKTGTIVVKVNGTDQAGNVVKKTYMVDTYYGYYYDAESGNWIVDTDETYPEGEGKNALYQIPVMKVENLAYGNYTVTISASHKDLYDHGQYDGTKYDFYLDAVRIYDPANDGAGNQVIEDAYKADGEGWPEYEELRNKLIAPHALGNGTFDNENIGVIFIDNTADQDGKEYSVADYANYGPNNELYLAPGQAVSFQLAAGEYTEGEATKYGQNIAGIHMAMKSVGGQTTVKVYNAAVNVDEVTARTINTATDLYYDITDLNGKVVVIQNTGNSILSITNIKTTHESNPNGVATTNFLMSRGIAAMALASLNPVEEEPSEPEVPEVTEPEVTEPEVTEPEVTEPEVTEPEVTEPEVTEPEVTEPEVTEPEVTEPEEPETFVPGKFQVRLSDDDVKVGSEVVVTVTTSKDVAYVLVNGVAVTDYSSSRWSGTRTWRVKLTADEPGDMEVTVVCCDRNDAQSEAVVKTVTVTEDYSSVGDWIRDMVIGLIDWLIGRP